MSDDLNENFRKQTATVWDASGVDSAGDPSFATPRQITVRWEEKAQSFFNAQGEEDIAKARVYVGEDLTLEDYLFLGTSAEADPTSLVGAYQIKGWHKVATPTAKKFVRKVFL